MSRTRIPWTVSAILLVTVLGCLCLPVDVRSQAIADLSPVPAVVTLQGSTFQRAAPTPTPNLRDRQCMSRRGDWERNRIPWSLFLGFIIFLVSLYLLTFLRFKNTIARVIISIVAAALLGPSIMAVIVQDLFRVCLSPPGFFGSLSAAMFGWTLGGSLGTLAVIWLLRYLVIRRKFRQELPAA